MSRNLTSGVLTAIAGKQVTPVIFFQAAFATGVAYIWSGIGTVVWNGHSWVGVGNLGKISPIMETTTGQARGVTVELSGIPEDLLAETLSEVQAQYPAYIWVGYLDSSGAVIADPEQRWSGRMDVAKIQESGETSVIQITVESKLVDLGRARERHWTHQDQAIDYPGDNGFLYMSGIQEFDVVWGQKGTSISNLPSLGGQSGSGSTGSGSGATGKGGGSGHPGYPVTP
jgi:hypothetical protein